MGRLAVAAVKGAEPLARCRASVRGAGATPPTYVAGPLLFDALHGPSLLFTADAGGLARKRGLDSAGLKGCSDCAPCPQPRLRTGTARVGCRPRSSTSFDGLGLGSRVAIHGSKLDESMTSMNHATVRGAPA